MVGLRVLLAPIGSRVLGDVLEHLLDGEERVDVVGACDRRGEIEPMVQSTQADVVIVGMGEDEMPPLCSDLLGRFPDLTVIGLAQDGRRALFAADDLGADDLMATVMAAKGARDDASPESSKSSSAAAGSADLRNLTGPSRPAA